MNLKTNELINLKYMMKVISTATWLMLLILAGCSDVSPSAEEPSAQERTITLNLDITTRADNGTDTPEKLRLWICDGSDKLIQYIENSPTWQASSTEGVDWITSLQAKIKTKEIESLNFYLVLNDAYSSVDDTSPISFNIDDIAALKNTPFVLTNYGGDNKVPMTGTQNLTLEANKLEYDVSIDATRCVAKLGIYCTKRTSSSKLIIYSFTLNKVPDKGYLFTPVDNDINYINYTENRDLLSGNNGGVTIATSYTTELPTDIESVESSFTKIDFDNPYLLENTYGDEQFVTEIVNPGTRYNLTVKYNFNGSDYEQTIYLPKIERNTWYKLYMRMKEIELDTYCQVNSWTTHEMEVPPFE